MTHRLSALAAAALAGLVSTSQATPSFVNGLVLDAAALDLSGGTAVNTGRVGYFSDLYYDPNRKEWWGLGDRGPGGGLLSYETRVQRFTIDVDATTGAISNFKIAQTVKFSNAGTALNGQAPNPGSVLSNAFDPEGFVISPITGNLLVSDEYGPSLYEFDRSGALVKTYTTPAGLVPRGPGGNNFAGDAGNTQGKRTNRGFEGLAVSPDGRFAYAMLQSAMLDEGAGNGTYNRIVKFDADPMSAAYGSALAQYAYKMEASSQGRGISALVALNDHQFMVLERNNRGIGVPDGQLNTPNKNVFLIDTTGATDVSGELLPGGGAALPAGVVAVTKSGQYLDLDANTLAELGGRSPEKWEGLTVGPQLANGSFVLLAGTDNDFSVSQIAGSNTQYDTYFLPGTDQRLICTLGSAFADCKTVGSDGTIGTDVAAGFNFAGFQLIPGVLHSYTVAGDELARLGYLQPVPEPQTWALMLGGLGLVAWTARRRRAALR